MKKDLEQFLGIVPAEQGEQSVEVDYFRLLQLTFRELKIDLERQGNTPRFRALQKEWAEQILGYWREQISLYKSATSEGRIQEGDSLLLPDGSSLAIRVLQDFDRDDEHVLLIDKRRGRAEAHNVSVTVSEETGLDQFLRPPRIESKFDMEDETRKSYTFEIIFREGKISTMSRTVVHTHRDFQLPFIKQTEVLDTSSFGVELPDLSVETQVEQTT